MTDRKQNRILKLGEFLTYLKKSLSGRERNSFERELQKDPFASEAMEGFEAMDNEDISNDMADLQSRLKKKTSRKGRIMFYRIAASIAILIAISSLFLLTKEKKQINQLAENYATSETLDVRRSEPVVQPEIQKLPAENVPQEKNKENDVAGAINAERSKKAEMQEIHEPAREQAESKKSYAEPRLAPSSAMAREKSSKFMSSDTAFPTEDSIHAVVITAKAENEGYSPPRPIDGMVEFEEYVRKNIHYPDSIQPRQRTEVIISFIVGRDGSIENINVERSPGKLFSDEALRLINNGPAWKPAEKDGRISEDKVRVTIVFR